MEGVEPPNSWFKAKRLYQFVYIPMLARLDSNQRPHRLTGERSTTELLTNFTSSAHTRLLPTDGYGSCPEYVEPFKPVIPTRESNSALRVTKAVLHHKACRECCPKGVRKMENSNLRDFYILLFSRQVRSARLCQSSSAWFYNFYSTLPIVHELHGRAEVSVHDTHSLRNTLFSKEVELLAPLTSEMVWRAGIAPT